MYDPTAVSLGNHLPRGKLAKIKCPIQIRMQHPVKQGVRHFKKRFAIRDAGIGYLNIYPAKRIDGRGHRTGNVLATGNVYGNRFGLAAVLDDSARRGNRLITVDISQHHPGTVVRQAYGYRRTNSMRGASNDRNLVLH